MELREQIEVRKQVQEAIAYYQTAGKEATLAEIDKPDGQFVQNERYLFAVDLEGNMLAHPIKKELTGRNLIDLRDLCGKSFIRKIVNIAKTRGYGFTEYEWQVPGREIERYKTTFIERVDGMALCCGFYNTKEPSYESIFDRLFGPLE
jgi:signal transduction histidine kinase